jgi:CNT family concentrative nucleoside transporter
MTEAPLVIRPYLATMTRSELMAMMTTGMATVAGGVMAAYVRMGADAGHLLTASLMAAPTSLVIAKIMVPESEVSPTKGTVCVEITRTDANLLDAACRGASDGLKLALNVAAMMIAFYALIHTVNWALSPLPEISGQPLTLERLLGWLMAPLAWLVGIEWKDAQVVGVLLGKKTVFNEFIAYQDLVSRTGLAPRSFTLATYALCGFANFASVAIMVGGIGSLEPSRRPELARYGMRAMVGGALATLMTAAVAGILL